MKLKQIFAGILTGAMLVTSIPVMDLGTISVWAEEGNEAAANTEPGSTGPAPDQTGMDPKPDAFAPTYRYKSIMGHPIEVNTDEDDSSATYRSDASLENIVDNKANFAFSRYNTGGMALGSELTKNNNIYIKLSSAQDVGRLLFWTQNKKADDYEKNIEPGTITRCKVSIATGAVTADSAEAMASVNWKEAKTASAFDSNTDDNYNADEQVMDRIYKSYDRVAHAINLEDLFETSDLANVGAVKIEVLNTAGELSGTVNTTDQVISCNEIYLLAKAANAKPMEATNPIATSALSAYADFETDGANTIDHLVDGKIVGDQDAANTANDNRMTSKNPDDAETEPNAKYPERTEYGTLRGNNNLYFTIPELTTEEGDSGAARTIGRLTYMAGLAKGAIERCRIYVSKQAVNPEGVGGQPKKVQNIAEEDWNLVFSNVDGEQTGWTETLEDFGADEPKTIFKDAEAWSAYQRSAWRDAHVVVFNRAQEARHVRIEVVKTHGTSDKSADANKFISGKRVYVYEAEKIIPNQETITELKLNQEELRYGVELGKISVDSSQKNYYTGDSDASWFWLKEKKDGETGIGEKLNGTENWDEGPNGPTFSKSMAREGFYTLRVKFRSEDAFSKLAQVYLNGKLVEGAEVITSETVSETIDGETVTRNQITVQIEYPEVVDPSVAFRQLKQYVKEGKANEVYSKGNVGTNGERFEYTIRSWNAFVAVYKEAKHATVGPMVDGVEAPEMIPSGYTSEQYEEMYRKLREYCEGDGLIKVAGRSVVDLGDKDLGISVTAPSQGVAWMHAQLRDVGEIAVEGKGTDDKPVKPNESGGFEIRDDGYIYGKATFDNGVEGNDIFKITSNSFAIRVKIKAPQRIPENITQSIVGKMDKGYGLQLMRGTGDTDKIVFYGFGDNWYQEDFKIAHPSEFYGQEHEILALFDKAAKDIILYVDGVRGTKDSPYKGREANIKCADDAIFTIGCNATKTESNFKDFTGGIKDFTMYIGDGVNYPAPEKIQEIKEGNEFSPSLSEEQIAALFEGKEPNLKIGSTLNMDYAMGDTTWTAIEGATTMTMKEGDVFKRFTKHGVTVVIEASKGFMFDDGTLDAVKLYANAATEAFDDEPFVGLDGSYISISHTFDSFDGDSKHPFDVLFETMSKILNGDATLTQGEAINVDANNADHKYTAATWETFKAAWDAVKKASESTKKYDDANVSTYVQINRALEDAVKALSKRSESCECVLSITGYENNGTKTLSMGEEAEATFDLMDGVSITADRTVGLGCAMHETDAAAAGAIEKSFTIGSTNEAEAEIVEQTKLKVAQPGQVAVVLTASVGGQEALTRTVTFTIQATAASQEQIQGLTDKIGDAKDKYKEEDYKGTDAESAWNELQQAIADAEAKAGQEGVSIQEINKALADLQEKIDALETAAQAAKATAVNNVKSALSEATEKYNAGSSKYTAETWAPFEALYNQANAGDAALNEMTLGELKKLAEDLLAALDALEEAQDPGPGPGPGPGGDTTPPGGQTPGPGGQTPGPGVQTPAAGLTVGQTVDVGGMKYSVTSATDKTVKLIKGKDDKNVTIPATVMVGSDSCKVTAIGSKAFSGCSKKLKSVTIGANVASIEKNAFSGCKKLAKVTFKGTVLKSVHKTAFKKTSKKISAKVPKALKKNKKIMKALKKAGLKKVK